MKDEPEGSMVGDAYVHEGTDKSRAVVLLTDIFGLPLVNCKLNADELSERLSCDVWVPDYFAGHPPFKVEELEPLVPDRAGVSMSFVSQIKKIILFITHLPGFWASRPPVADSRIAEFITRLKEEKNYTKIGAVGYCYGGAATVRLASRDLVDSVVVCHPGPVTTNELKAMKVSSAPRWSLGTHTSYNKLSQVPSAFVCAECKPHSLLKSRLTHL